MSGVNKVIIIGNLGKDPEVRNLEGGAKVATFSVATSESWKDNEGNKKEATEWHNVVVWNKLAEVAEKYLQKGAKIYVEGKLKTRNWEKDGVTRYTTEIICQNMTMLGAPPVATPGASSAAPGGGDPGPEVDDLPF